MPRKAPRPCTAPGCPQLVREQSRCEAHRKDYRRRESERRRAEGTHGAFYTTRPWRSLRRRYAAKHPVCERCAEEGQTTPLDVVDHIVPWQEGGAKLSMDNLQSLCHVHHNRKHARGRGRAG